MVEFPMPKIDSTLCNSCGLCVQDCPGGAVRMEGKLPTLDKPENCTYCGVCEDICPEGAISLEYEIG